MSKDAAGKPRRSRRATSPGTRDGRPLDPAHPAGSPGDGAVEDSQTRDDTDAGWGEVSEPSERRDDWLRQQRPPHWE